MADEKHKNEEQPQQQNTQGGATPINPFRDAGATENTQATPEEEAEREQQLKEAMTERD